MNNTNGQTDLQTELLKVALGLGQSGSGNNSNNRYQYNGNQPFHTTDGSYINANNWTNAQLMTCSKVLAAKYLDAKAKGLGHPLIEHDSESYSARSSSKSLPSGSSDSEIDIDSLETVDVDTLRRKKAHRKPNGQSPSKKRKSTEEGNPEPHEYSEFEMTMLHEIRALRVETNQQRDMIENLEGSFMGVTETLHDALTVQNSVTKQQLNMNLGKIDNEEEGVQITACLHQLDNAQVQRTATVDTMLKSYRDRLIKRYGPSTPASTNTSNDGAMGIDLEYVIYVLLCLFTVVQWGTALFSCAITFFKFRGFRVVFAWVWFLCFNVVVPLYILSAHYNLGCSPGDS